MRGRDIVDTKQLADDYDVAPITIGRWERAGLIPSIRPTAGTLRFSRRAVAERFGLNVPNGEEST